MNAALPNPFVFDKQAYRDKKALAAVADAIAEWSEGLPPEQRRDLRDLTDDDPLPMFLSDPSPEFMSATDMMPITNILSRYV